MKTLLKVAWVASAAPLVVGSGIFVAWLLTRKDNFIPAGLVTIFVGLGSVAVAVVCLAIYLRRNWHSVEVSRQRLMWQATALISLILLNFVAAAGFVVAAVMIDTCYSLSITNQGNEPLRNVRVSVGGFGVDFKDIPAGGTAKRNFWIEGEGALILTALRGEQEIEGMVDGYVTPGMGGKIVKVIVDPQGEVIAKQEYR